MKARLALVFWWLGALLGGTLLAGGVASAILGRAGSESMAIAAAIGGAGILIAVPAWAVSFVLGGSFWRPPKIT